MHNIIVEGRKSITLSGIKECKTYEDNIIVLITDIGLLTIKGEGIKIESFSVETGDMLLFGKVNSVTYKEQGTTAGLLKRVIK